jgi:hypothetical protein
VASNKRGKQREYALAETARLFLEGKSQRAIAVELGVVHSQVVYDLRIIFRHWRASQVRDFDILVETELRQIEHLQATYWAAWYRSQRDAVVETTERVDGEAAKVLARVQRKVGPVGDAVYLAGVQWCIERRIRLLGLDAPQRITLETVRAEAERLASVTEYQAEELIAEAQRLLKVVGT